MRNNISQMYIMLGQKARMSRPMIGMKGTHESMIGKIKAHGYSPIVSQLVAKEEAKEKYGSLEKKY
jgi:hypothetical protein